MKMELTRSKQGSHGGGGGRQ